MKMTDKVYTQFETPDDPPFICTDESLTQEHFAESCDINRIMENYTYTGIMPEKPGAVYGDFTNVNNYQKLLGRIIEIQDNFLAMPPDVRARFGNDPAQFIAFCENPANLPEMQKLGFTSEEYNRATVKTPVASTPDDQAVSA